MLAAVAAVAAAVELWNFENAKLMAKLQKYGQQAVTRSKSTQTLHEHLSWRLRAEDAKEAEVVLCWGGKGGAEIVLMMGMSVMQMMTL